jgi:sarcosine oxidase subunit gamma
MADPWTLDPRPAFHGLLASVGEGDGVTVTEIDGLALATVLIARPGFAERFGAPLPDGPRRAENGGVTLLGIGPGRWLALAPAGTDLVGRFADLAAVTDQSDGLGLLQVAGPRAADALAKGCMIDLDPSAFGADAVAVTTIAHVGVTLWRAEDGFVLAVPRSYAGSFWHWLAVSAAEFGCRIA